jgi:predicted nucleotidyltransferase component of viral defense system
MIRPQEIRDMALQKKVPPHSVEKDYVLSWFIAALFRHPRTQTWRFKGGTCLKKCYFEDYRFSEDLDYSATDTRVPTMRELEAICMDLSSWIYDHSGIEVAANRQKIEILPNEHGRTTVQVRLYYKGPISPVSHQQWPRVKLDVTYGECLTDTPLIKKIYHPYSDARSVDLSARSYSFSELFAEKLRALLERFRPRDVYDVVHCFERTNPQDVQRIFEQFDNKCASKKVPLQGIEHLFQQLKAAKPFWEEQLSHQIGDLLPFEIYAQKLETYLERHKTFF